MRSCLVNIRPLSSNRICKIMEFFLKIDISKEEALQSVLLRMERRGCTLKEHVLLCSMYSIIYLHYLLDTQIRTPIQSYDHSPSNTH